MASAERRGFVRDTVTDALVTTTDDALAADGGTLPARQSVVAGHDGVNTQVVKTSAAGVLQVDVLSSPAGASTVALDAPTLAALESITAVGPLTDTQLRAAVVPTADSRLPAALDADGGVKVHAQSAIPVTDNAGSLTVDSAQLPGALAAGGGMKVEGVAGGVAQPVSGTVTANAGTGPFPVSDNAGSLTVDAPVGTPAFVRLSDGAAAVAPLTDTQLRASAVPVSLPTLTKGTQGALGASVQDLRDAGRNPTNYFHAAPIITTTAEVMQTLTGYKSGAAVAATATPAVVTAGKTYRVERITVSYIAATVIGGALLRLHANLSGVGVVGSPLVWAQYVGIPAVFTAGAAATYVFDFPEGLEFAAGTGIALGVIGGGAVPTTGTITGYVMASIEGYEY